MYGQLKATVHMLTANPNLLNPAKDREMQFMVKMKGKKKKERADSGQVQTQRWRTEHCFPLLVRTGTALQDTILPRLTRCFPGEKKMNSEKLSNHFSRQTVYKPFQNV